MMSSIDVRHVLAAVAVPTLVLHRTGDGAVRVEHGRYIAWHIPGTAKALIFGKRALVRSLGTPVHDLHP
jgi:pimeloyl-ACP methyl ester carboxylesterase